MFCVMINDGSCSPENCSFFNTLLDAVKAAGEITGDGIIDPEESDDESVASLLKHIEKTMDEKGWYTHDLENIDVTCVYIFECKPDEG